MLTRSPAPITGVYPGWVPVLIMFASLAVGGAVLAGDALIR
jgi:hypothetical protein